MILLAGSIAPAKANLNLAIQLVMGVALVAGMLLARRKMFRAHGLCQAAVVLLNLFVIAIYMLPVFRRGVLGQLPGAIGDPFYTVSTAHAACGMVAEVLGLYIVLRAGTNLLPAGLQFRNYKRWMRVELSLWWLVIALGTGTYVVWYAGGKEAAVAAPPAKAASSPEAAVSSTRKAGATPQMVTVSIGNFAFDPREIRVEPGATVVWKNGKGRHTVVADDNSFTSPVMTPGEEFRYTFEREGRFPYYCSLHGGPGGKDMSGVVTVAAGSKP